MLPTYSLKGFHIYIKKVLNMKKNRTVRYMNETYPLYGEIVLGPTLARAQLPPLIFPSSQPHSDRDPPWPGPIFLLMVCPSLHYNINR